MKILIIEDDEQSNSIPPRKLTSSGYEVEVAINGKDALIKLNKNKISLIILDLLMPEMSGWKFMYEMSRTQHKNIPIIILTNASEAAYPSRVPLVMDFLIKADVSLDELVKKVGKHMSAGETKKKSK